MQRKVALVTGVSRLKGIGKAICIELAKQGIDVFFTYWMAYDRQMPWQTQDNEPDLIQHEIREIGVRCERMELDLGQDHAVETLFAEVEARLGTPSVLVNNATYSTYTDINTLTGEELDKHYLVNVRATTLLCTEFVRRFKDSTYGSIINITSGQSLGAMSQEIAYAITKAAIEMLTRTISHEIAAKGITINAVNPGLTDSGWMDEETQAHFLPRFPMGRLGQPEDAARLVAFLASEQARWITGQVIHSEGGFIREKYAS